MLSSKVLQIEAGHVTGSGKIIINDANGNHIFNAYQNLNFFSPDTLALSFHPSIFRKRNRINSKRY